MWWRPGSGQREYVRRRRALVVVVGRMVDGGSSNEGRDRRDRQRLSLVSVTEPDCPSGAYTVHDYLPQVLLQTPKQSGANTRLALVDEFVMSLGMCLVTRAELGPRSISARLIKPLPAYP